MYLNDRAFVSLCGHSIHEVFDAMISQSGGLIFLCSGKALSVLTHDATDMIPHVMLAVQTYILVATFTARSIDVQ